MKILHITPREFSGAPARAVFSLHREILRLGHDSHILTDFCETEETGISELGGTVEKGKRFYQLIQKRGFDENFADSLSSLFSLSYPGRQAIHPLFAEADLIHLHDVKDLLSPATIGQLVRSGKRLVWSLSDAWAFTGGCHQPGFCQKFTADCSACPQLESDQMGIPREILIDKKARFGGGEITFATDHPTLQELAESSSFHSGRKVHYLPPGLDPWPSNRAQSRETLKLPAKAFIVLIQCEATGIHERGRQSVRDLLDATVNYNTFKRLSRADELVVIVTGVSDGFTHPILPVQCWNSSNLERRTLLLNAADLVVFPRMEENNTAAVFECYRAGTPIVAFDAAGISKIVDNGRTGTIIENREIGRMAEAISLLALRPDRLAEWSAECLRFAAAQKTGSEIAQAYLELYDRIPAARQFTPENVESDGTPRFMQFCWELADTVLADIPPQMMHSLNSADASTLRLKNAVTVAIQKLALMEVRFGRYEKAAQANESDSFSKAFVSLKKLQGTLIKCLRNLEKSDRDSEITTANNQIILLSNRLNRLRESIKATPVTQRSIPHFLENWLARSVVAKLNPLAGKGLGSLAHYPPRPIQPETFPRLRKIHPRLPTIAIVTPSFMQGHFIEKTITSVVGQNYPHLRYAVEDAGSTDTTIDVLQKHAAGITVWNSSPDTGQARAIREGFEKIQGNIMAWLNSDDTLLPGTLHFVGEYFRCHPDVDAIYGHRIVINDEDQEVARWVLPPHDPKLLSCVDYIPQETLFWRKHLWEKVGGIDPKFRFAMDWDLLLRFSESGAKIVRVPYFLGCFRVHSEQKTSAEMNTVGAEEVAHLRVRTLGRLPTPQELGNVHRSARKRSSLYETLLKYHIRL